MKIRVCIILAFCFLQFSQSTVTTLRLSLRSNYRAVKSDHRCLAEAEVEVSAIPIFQQMAPSFQVSWLLAAQNLQNHTLLISVKCR
ncbi:hypothetical protein SKAU_G00026350 [Synaphobranchus kaupii]|uniref:Secreted protein n=1 Tax=Synaphobranchus kaupii TaxID=118154 RepID=A0A9Q1GEQ3_SYNKA|nr:hypothetical protein SKAU_G00026350 [Synaphobranchus kaupii]